MKGYTCKALASVGVLVLLVLTGCSNNKSTAFDASNVDCTEVATMVTAAQAELVKATAVASEAKGTPDAKPASAKARAADTKIDALTARQKKCSMTTVKTGAKADNAAVVTVALTQSGFAKSDFKVNQPVNKKAAATATTGPGRFTTVGYVDSADKAVAFLGSGTPSAQAALAHLEKTTGATKAELLDTSNWVVVQFGTAVRWNGNSSFHGAVVGTNSSRVDQPGTVGLFFVPPMQVKAGTVTSLGVLRGACANPQFHMPTPPVAPSPQPPPPSPSPVCTHDCNPPPSPCVKPPAPGSSGYTYHPSTCTYTKDKQSKDCMLNGGPNCPPNPAHQPVQHNPCCYTGPTDNGDAPDTEPSPAPRGPSPAANSPAPDPNSGGYDSGSSTGSGTPGGSPCSGNDCSTSSGSAPSGSPAPNSGNTGQTHSANPSPSSGGMPPKPS